MSVCCATSWQGVELHVSRNEAISGVTGASTPASIYNTVQVRRNPTNPVKKASVRLDVSIPLFTVRNCLSR